MKKVLVFISALFYLSLSIGVTVNIHYCMDKKTDWWVGHGETNICITCGMLESHDSGCCRNESAVFKINIDQDKTFFSTLIPVVTKDFYDKSHILHVIGNRSQVETSLLKYEDPPPISVDRRLHLLYGVFLI